MDIIRPYVRREIVTPIVIIAFLILYVTQCLKSAAPYEHGTPTESFYPFIIFLFAFPCTLVLLFRELISVRKKIKNGQLENRKLNIRPVLVTACMLLFVVLFNSAGFIISAMIFVYVVMFLYDDKPQHFLKKIIYTAIIVGFVYGLYGLIFDIRFPLFFWS